MKIAYFSHAIVPSRQASSVHVVNMTASLAGLGHEVTLHAYVKPFEGESTLPNPDQIAAHYGVRPGFNLEAIKELPVPGRNGLAALASALKQRFSGCDLIIGRHPKACAFAALMGLPTVFETHQPISCFPAADANVLRIALKRRAYRKVVTISNPLRDILLEETDWPARDLLVLHDGAPSIDGVKPTDFGPPGQMRVGYVGHLYKGRGIEIIAELAARLCDVAFYVIGGNESDIAFWRGETRALTNLHFTGFVAPVEAAAMRLSLDVLLAPYQADVSVPGGRVTAQWMSPLKIFEYMAAGKAFISSDFPVLREVLRDEDNCILVSAADADAWETALRRLLTDAALRQRLGQSALRDFKDNYSWDTRAARIVEAAFSDAPAGH
jgi:glycosyltransferase involved in cell wall biosynthesis